jgi:hypothetical protein
MFVDGQQISVVLTGEHDGLPLMQGLHVVREYGGVAQIRNQPISSLQYLRGAVRLMHVIRLRHVFSFQYR